jgi:hypothetical protein
MRKLPRLWRALEALPGLAAERLEWCRLVGDEWPIVGPLFRQTGALVDRVWCPSPGGPDCPRRVIQQDDDRIVAVCGDQPRNCDTLSLSMDDIAVLELDVRRLAAALAQPLGLSRDPRWVQEPDVLQLGMHEVAAGLGVPILLLWARTPDQADRAIAGLVHSVAGPFALTTPTDRFVGAQAREKIKLAGGIQVPLDDVVGVDHHNRLVGQRPPDAVFARVRDAVARPETGARPARAWMLPPDARWEELVIDFVEREVVNIRFRGETKRFEPEQLRMKSSKNGRPTLQWTLMQQLALAGGELDWRDRGATTSIKKRMQVLADRLKAAFGVEGRPIVWDKAKSAYVARVVLRASGLHRSEAGLARPRCAR